MIVGLFGFGAFGLLDLTCVVGRWDFGTSGLFSLLTLGLWGFGTL